MITSLTNEKMKEYAKLNQNKYREEKQLFIVEGPHLVEEAKNLNLLVETFTTDEKVFYCRFGCFSIVVMRKA